MPNAIILKNKNTYSWTPLQQPPWGQKEVAIEECRDCLPKQMAITGLSKVAGCLRKSPPTWLVLTGHSAWHFFIDGVFKIKYPRLAA